MNFIVIDIYYFCILEYICICYNVLDYKFIDNNLFIDYNIMLIYLGLNNIIKII